MTLLLAAGVVVVAASCDYGAHHNRVVPGGNRFALVIEPGRTEFDASPYLVDAATGDVWMLDGAGIPSRWVRLADGPEDAAVLGPRELLGLAGGPPEGEEAESD